MVRRRTTVFRPRHAGLPGGSPGVDLAGFTLIELLVVIAIIALLMAILVPTLSRVRKQARAMVCQSHLRQWGTVLAAYTEDNQGRLPGTLSGLDGLWLLRGAAVSAKDPNAPQSLFHHFRTKDIVRCPMASQPAGNGSVNGGGKNSFGFIYEIEGTTGSVFGAWEIATPAPTFRGSYGFNQWLFKGFRKSFIDAVMLRDGRIDLDVLSLRRRSDIPVLLDATLPWSEPRDTEMPPQHPEGDGIYGMGSFCIDRHNGFVNGLFLDWSVRKVGVKELWTLNWYTEFNRAGRWTKAGGVKRQNWPIWMRPFRDY